MQLVFLPDIILWKREGFKNMDGFCIPDVEIYEMLLETVVTRGQKQRPGAGLPPGQVDQTLVLTLGC